MKKKSNQIIDFFQLFDRLISDMETGKKRLPNGSVYRESSIQNYKHVKKKLLEFAVARNFGFRFRKIRNLSQRGMIIERTIGKNFIENLQPICTSTAIIKIIM